MCIEGVPKTMYKKEKMMVSVTSNFSFSQIVFKRLVMQTRKSLGPVWEGVNPTFDDPMEESCRKPWGKRRKCW